MLERINDNAYKLDLPSEYGGVSATFNVTELTPCKLDPDLRTNHLEEGGDDIPLGAQVDEIDEPVPTHTSRVDGPLTRGRLRTLQEALPTIISLLLEDLQ